MEGAKSAAAKWINMYNPADFATNPAWRLNNLFKHFLAVEDPQFPTLPGQGNITLEVLAQMIFGGGTQASDQMWRLLPPPSQWGYRYVIEYDENGVHYFRVPYTQEGELDVDRSLWTEITAGLQNAGLPGPNAYEIIAFTSVANAPAIGTTPIPTWFDANIDINNISDLESAGGSDVRQNHSFQFNHDAAMTWTFWENVKQQTDFAATY